MKKIADMTNAEFASLTGADFDYIEAIATYERAVKHDDECPSESTIHEVNFAHAEMVAAEDAAKASHAEPRVMLNVHRMG